MAGMMKKCGDDIGVEDLEALDIGQTSRSLEELPDELILKILSYVPRHELALRVALVNRRIYRLALDPELWTEVEFPTQSVLSSDQCLNCLKHISLHVCQLGFMRRTDVDYILSAYIQDSSDRDVLFPQLETIEMIYCDSLSPLFFNSVVDGKIPKLTEFKMLGACLTDDIPLRAFRKLTKLTLFASRVYERFLWSLAENCDSLVELNMEEVTFISNKDWQTFLQARGAQLRTLKMDGEGNDDKAFSNLSLCVNLEVLEVSFCDQMGSAGLGAIAQLKKLKQLVLKRGKALTADGFVQAFSTKNMARLEVLDLSECAELDDCSVIVISKTCPLLKHLHFNWCWDLSDMGITSLIVNCPKISNFGLIGINGLTCKPFADIWEKLPSLSYLDLRQCPDIDDSFLKVIQEHMPGISIMDYYGELEN